VPELSGNSFPWDPQVEKTGFESVGFSIDLAAASEQRNSVKLAGHVRRVTNGGMPSGVQRLICVDFGGLTKSGLTLGSK
jgi:hypothetical protein